MAGEAWPEGVYGLYVHWPFCPYRCYYCDFAVVVESARRQAAGGDRRGRYAAALLAEWRQKPLPPASTRLVSVYFGGGTPSLMDGETVARLLEAVAQRAGVAVGGLEISMEANPGTVDRDSLREFRAAGVNRLSVGVQALDDAVLKALGRRHTAEQARQAVAWARQAGFENINLDAIYGLPGQDLAGWQATIEGLLALAPTHLSLYQLQWEAGTRLERDRRLGLVQVPDEETVAAMEDWAQERLARAGFVRYEISNYARPGYQCRHNRLYWELAGYLALGMAAHAYRPGCRGEAGRRSWNQRGLDRYLAAVESGQDPVAGGEAMDWREESRQFVWLGLRLSVGVSRKRFLRRFGVDLEERFGTVGDSLEALGLLSRSLEAWRLTPRGRAVANRVAAALLDA